MSMDGISHMSDTPTSEITKQWRSVVDQLTKENDELKASEEMVTAAMSLLRDERDTIRAELAHTESMHVELSKTCAGLVDERDELRAKLEQAEANCAQMWEIIRDNLHHDESHDENPSLDCDVCRAISTSCGTGWASPEKVKRLEARIKSLTDGHKENLEWVESAEKEHLESVDISAVRLNCEQALAETEDAK